MEKFAFIIHPIKAQDVARRYPIAKFIPDRIIEAYIQRRDPIVTAKVEGIRSITGVEAEGWFIGCPFTPRLFLELPIEEVYKKLEMCGKIAEDLGAKILGLGAFTSVVGDGGITLSQRLPNIAVTTGNSYTVATAVRGAIKGAELMGIDLANANVAVVGATGSIGATSAELLARDVRQVGLVGRSVEKLTALADRLKLTAEAKINIYTDVEAGLKDADIVITVSSAAEAIVLPHHIKRGAVVCDVARPRDVSISVSKERNDVLIIEGGVVKVPGNMRSFKDNGQPFSFGFPQGTAYACMSETIALALENRYENFTLGKDVQVSQVDEISRICDRHGFELDGFRSFERAVSEEDIANIRANAGRIPVKAAA